MQFMTTEHFTLQTARAVVTLARLPELLWLFHMGVVLRWVYDSSPDQAETRLLVERTTPVIGQLVGLSRLPGLRGSANDLMELFDLLSGRP